MSGQTRADSAHDRTAEPLSFPVALGHRLRQLREANDQTAADVAAAARLYGLGWDRSTVARVELGQRTVSAAELLLLTVVLGVPLADLLPTEDVRLTDAAGATPQALRRALDQPPDPRDGWDTPAAAAAMLDWTAELGQRLGEQERALRERLPGTPIYGRRLARAMDHLRDETTVKVAGRLSVAPVEVVIAAEVLWRRSVAAERDARVEALGATDGTRARQARRGHVTRALIGELGPAITQLHVAPDDDGKAR